MSAAPTLIDTNVLSELMRVDPSPDVAAFVQSLAAPMVSAVAFHELAYGAEALPLGARRTRFSAIIAEFRSRFRDRTITIDAKIAEISGSLRAGEKRAGFDLKPIDALIAASAISASARLATRNTKDFARLGIVLVNPWMD